MVVKKKTQQLQKSDSLVESLGKSKGFQVLENGREDPNHMAIREKLLEQALAKMTRDIETFTVQVNSESLDSVVHFVDNSFQESELQMPYQEIPTALIFGGINTSDHEFLYQKLLGKIADKGHSVARLYSKDCQNMKGMMKNIIEQFMRLELELIDEDREQTLEETLRFVPDSKTARLRNHDIRLLEAWYTQRSKNASSPSYLVLMIHDFEAFDIQLFQNLTSILSECQKRIPFVLLVNIATTIDGFQTQLPTSTLSLLKTERFRLCASDKVVNGLTEQLFLRSHSSVKMDSKSLNSLLNEYALYDLSVTAFLNGVKYATMMHYYTSPLSAFLSVDPSDSTRNTVIDSLASRDLDMLRRLPSFKKYIEEKFKTEEGEEEAKKLLTQDAYLRSKIPLFLEDLAEYHESFSYAFQCLFSLQTLVNNPAFRKKFAVLYSLSLSTEETFENGIRTLLQIFSKKSLEDIEKYLKILVDVLESAPDALEDYRQKFEDLLLEIDDYKAEEDSDEISGEEENSQMYGQKRPFRGEEPVFEAIPKLKQRKTATSRRTDIIVDGIDEGKDKTFRGFTLRMITTLRSFFKENLRHFSTQVWYEIVYFCSSGRLYKAFFPPTRLVTQAAIENPQYFVGHFSLECQSDTTVMYNLHLECGRLINLYDWFIAFKSVVDPDKKEDTKTLQVRFMQGTSELQYMGFIKATERKTDHVERLTWGT